MKNKLYNLIPEKSDELKQIKKYNEEREEKILHELVSKFQDVQNKMKNKRKVFETEDKIEKEEYENIAKKYFEEKGYEDRRK